MSVNAVSRTIEAGLDIRRVDDFEYDLHLRNIAVYGYTVVGKFVGVTLVDRLKMLIDAYWQKTVEEKYSGRPDRDSKVQNSFIICKTRTNYSLTCFVFHLCGGCVWTN